ncbi:hypothetical protein HPB51_001662 [Rhipicephalus microplus]|uniref:Uncharacterized protein n=1 Tax=Rhipicephalus microplus TaxID=6941 RepID=A0A9J6EW50_RHIMP|nr:hypothetical protein HPB51_001662 [Rhipicephalus microplus]
MLEWNAETAFRVMAPPSKTTKTPTEHLEARNATMTEAGRRSLPLVKRKLSSKREKTHNRATVRLHESYIQAQANNHRIAASDVRLLGFQDFSDEQTYFIAGCYLRCGSAEESCAMPFRHNRWFSAAFGCPPNTPMNPEERCAFW